MFNVTSITNIEYQVQDLERSIEFFTDTLGFYVQRRVHKTGRLADTGNASQRGEHVFVGLGETWVELLPPPQGIEPGTDYALRDRPNYVFAVAVDDIDTAMRDLRTRHDPRTSSVILGTTGNHPPRIDRAADRTALISPP
jgi:catechol 2,3-dioxygenase-like lactoylglutathione lyase family enzyme